MPAVVKRSAKAEEWEDDCGFKFQRKKTAAVDKKPVVARNAAKSTTGRDKAGGAAASKKKAESGHKETAAKRPAGITPPIHTAPTATVALAPIKPSAAINSDRGKRVAVAAPMTPKQMLDKRRRRSSFSLRPNARHSSIGINLTQNPPPVCVEDYHRHAHPDLPGPVRMRQLLIWAVQKCLQDMELRGQNRLAPDTLIAAAESLIQGLLNNKVNTSWYQRPQQQQASKAIRKAPNPVNQTNVQCLEWMLSYQRQLHEELQYWEEAEEGPVVDELQHPEPETLLDASDRALLNEIVKPDTDRTIDECTRWIAQSSLLVDRFNWNLRSAAVFQDRSTEFCEDVFRRIFARYFNGAESRPVESMAILRAMSQTAMTTSS